MTNVVVALGFWFCLVLIVIFAFALVLDAWNGDGG
jgi:hypothetical protein